MLSSELYPAAPVWTLINELYWMANKLLERRLYALEISVSQARVLVIVKERQPVKPSLIALLLFQETQSITGILHRIESKGWIERVPDPKDKRAIGLQLTKAGTEIVDKVLAQAKDLNNVLFNVLTKAEQQSALKALKKIRSRGFEMPETDFKLRRASLHEVWST